jgi:uncharacterized protein (TIGR02145 family)
MRDFRSVPWRDKPVPEGDNWRRSTDPSPAGWRIPTLSKIQTLFDANKVRNEWTTVNGVEGRKFTDKATGNTLFLPAAGFRNDDAMLCSAGSGYYRSSTKEYFLYFDSDDASWSSNELLGFSIRPVEDVNTPTSDRGVIINGVKWATRNIAAAGTFADKPEDMGMYYQWNRKKAWAATGDMTGWDATTPEGKSWQKSNTPCPAGWRIPIYSELKKLFDSDKVSNKLTTENGIFGIKFTDKANGNTLFLPATGGKSGTDGELRKAGSVGHYWSSTQRDSINAGILSFSDSDVATGYGARYYGFSVRAVAE